MKSIYKHIFLLLALLAAGLSVLCFLLLEQNAPGATEEQYISAIQQRVKEEMKGSYAELDSVTSLLKEQPHPTFEQFAGKPDKYPYFVFRNGQLMYWSDYRFIPDYARLSTVATAPKLIDFEQGRYIVSHRRVPAGTDVLDVYALVTVYRYYHNNNAYLQSGYNPDLFAIDPLAIVNKRQNTYQAIYDNTSAFLFSVIPPAVNGYHNHSTPVNTVILAALAFALFGLYVWQVMVWLNEKRRYELGFLCLAGYLVSLRVAMLYYGVPFLFIESDLFNAKYYASSVLVPSLGDLLLNTLVVALLVFYWVRHYYHSQSYQFVLRLPAWLKLCLSVICVVLSYTVFCAVLHRDYQHL